MGTHEWHPVRRVCGRGKCSLGLAQPFCACLERTNLAGTFTSRALKRACYQANAKSRKLNGRVRDCPLKLRQAIWIHRNVATFVEENLEDDRDTTQALRSMVAGQRLEWTGYRRVTTGTKIPVAIAVGMVSAGLNPASFAAAMSRTKLTRPPKPPRPRWKFNEKVHARRCRVETWRLKRISSQRRRSNHEQRLRLRTARFLSSARYRLRKRARRQISSMLALYNSMGVQVSSPQLVAAESLQDIYNRLDLHGRLFRGELPDSFEQLPDDDYSI